MQRKVVLYIACSLDGYIAKPNDDLSFLSIVEKEGEDYGYSKLIEQVDTVILGRKTYDWVMKQVPEFPHAQKQTFVITRTPKPSLGNTHFYDGSLPELVQPLKSQPGGIIFCDGGAEVANELLQQHLIDELQISIIPVILGQGIRLFKEGIPEQQWQLIKTQSFETGLVQVHYGRKED